MKSSHNLCSFWPAERLHSDIQALNQHPAPMLILSRKSKVNLLQPSLEMHKTKLKKLNLTGNTFTDKISKTCCIKTYTTGLSNVVLPLQITLYSHTHCSLLKDNFKTGLPRCCFGRTSQTSFICKQSQSSRQQININKNLWTYIYLYICNTRFLPLKL